MTFRTSIKVRFSDEDHARIVYYPRFFHFFHVAFEDFFESEGVPYRACLDEGVGWPAVPWARRWSRSPKVKRDP